MYAKYFPAKPDSSDFIAVSSTSDTAFALAVLRASFAPMLNPDIFIAIFATVSSMPSLSMSIGLMLSSAVASADPYSNSTSSVAGPYFFLRFIHRSWTAPLLILNPAAVAACPKFLFIFPPTASLFAIFVISRLAVNDVPKISFTALAANAIFPIASDAPIAIGSARKNPPASGILDIPLRYPAIA